MINKKALRIISFIIVVVIAILLLFEALKKDTDIDFEPQNIRRIAILCADNSVFD